MAQVGNPIMCPLTITLSLILTLALTLTLEPRVVTSLGLAPQIMHPP